MRKFLPGSYVLYIVCTRRRRSSSCESERLLWFHSPLQNKRRALHSLTHNPLSEPRTIGCLNSKKRAGGKNRSQWQKSVWFLAKGAPSLRCTPSKRLLSLSTVFSRSSFEWASGFFLNWKIHFPLHLNEKNEKKSFKVSRDAKFDRSKPPPPKPPTHENVT